MKHKQLVALSFDSPTLPILSLDFNQIVRNYRLYCRGYDSTIHTVIKSKLFLDQNNHPNLLAKELHTYPESMFGQPKVLKLFSINKTIPTHSVRNKDWIFSITLSNPKAPVNQTKFPLIMDKIEKKSSQNWYTAWILEQIYILKITWFMELTWESLYELFQKIDAENPCTIVCSDGQDLIVYQGRQSDSPLYYLRSCPPHYRYPAFKTGPMHFKLEGDDSNHTLILLSTEPISHHECQMIHLNQMLVMRSGELIWDCDPLKAALEEPEKEIPTSIKPSGLKSLSAIHKICLVDIPCHHKKEQKKITISTEWDAEPPRLYSLSHQTVYEYESPVYSSSHLLRLQPIADLTQTLLSYELTLRIDDVPVKTSASSFIGAFGNNATYLEIKQPYQKLEVISEATVAITVLSKERFNSLHNQRTIPLIWMPWDRIMMQAYLVPPELPESQLRILSDYALAFIKRNNNDLYDILNDINRTIYEDYTYLSGSTTLETTPFDVYVNHRGVCQDFANLFICLARLLNIPARYRTGYIYTARDYANTEQGDATHAWLEVFLPLIGWTGYDPTNYCLAEENHVRVACGRTYSDTAPTSGTIYSGGGGEKLSINVKMVKHDVLDFKALDIIRLKKDNK